MKEYCHPILRNLRVRFKVTDIQYTSLTACAPVMKEATGRQGSTYYCGKLKSQYFGAYWLTVEKHEAMSWGMSSTTGFVSTDSIIWRNQQSNEKPQKKKKIPVSCRHSKALILYRKATKFVPVNSNMSLPNSHSVNSAENNNPNGSSVFAYPANSFPYLLLKTHPRNRYISWPSKSTFTNR